MPKTQAVCAETRASYSEKERARLRVNGAEGVSVTQTAPPFHSTLNLPCAAHSQPAKLLLSRCRHRGARPCIVEGAYQAPGQEAREKVKREERRGLHSRCGCICIDRGYVELLLGEPTAMQSGVPLGRGFVTHPGSEAPTMATVVGHMLYEVYIYIYTPSGRCRDQDPPGIPHSNTTMPWPPRPAPRRGPVTAPRPSARNADAARPAWR